MENETFNLDPISAFISNDPPENPKEVIKQFFQMHDLEEAKKYLWEMTKSAACTETFETPIDRDYLFGFSESLMAFVMAVHSLQTK